MEQTLIQMNIGDAVTVGICDDYLSFNGKTGTIVGFDFDGEPLVSFDGGRSAYIAHRDIAVIKRRALFC